MSISRITGQDVPNGGPASTSVVFTFPSQPTQGNLLIARFSFRIAGTTVNSVPSGWAAAATPASQGDTNCVIYWKIAGASEPVTHTFGLSASVKTAGIACEYNSTNGFTGSLGIAVKTNGTTTGAHSSPATGTTSAPSGAHILGVAIFANDDSSITWASHTGTNISMAEISENASTGGNASTRTNASSADGIVTTGNNTFTATATISGAEDWGIMFAVFYEQAPPTVSQKTGAFQGYIARAASPVGSNQVAFTFVD